MNLRIIEECQTTWRNRTGETWHRCMLPDGQHTDDHECVCGATLPHLLRRDR